MAVNIITSNSVVNSADGAVMNGGNVASNFTNITPGQKILNKDYFTSANESQGFSFITGAGLGSVTGTYIKLQNLVIADQTDNKPNSTNGSVFYSTQLKVSGIATTGVNFAVLDVHGLPLMPIDGVYANQRNVLPTTGVFAEDKSIVNPPYTYKLHGVTGTSGVL